MSNGHNISWKNTVVVVPAAMNCTKMFPYVVLNYYVLLAELQYIQKKKCRMYNSHLPLLSIFFLIVGTCVTIETIVAFAKLHQVVLPSLHKTA